MPRLRRFVRVAAVVLGAGVLGAGNAATAWAQGTGADPHAGHTGSTVGTPTRVFHVDGLRVDAAAPPAGSGIGRAGATFPGGTYVHLVYGRPYARGRIVYGGLVAWNTPWVTGAHQATELTTTGPLRIGGQTLAAGTYSLVTTPRPGRAWTLHLNRGLGGHLTDTHDPALDVLTVEVTPDTLAAPVPALTFRFEATGDGAVLSFAWDRLGFRVPIAAAPAVR